MLSFVLYYTPVQPTGTKMVIESAALAVRYIVKCDPWFTP